VIVLNNFKKISKCNDKYNRDKYYHHRDERERPSTDIVIGYISKGNRLYDYADVLGRMIDIASFLTVYCTDAKVR